MPLQTPTCKMTIPFREAIACTNFCCQWKFLCSCSSTLFLLVLVTRSHGRWKAGWYPLHYEMNNATMQVFFHDLLWVAVAFKSHVLRDADINVMGHISDGCIAPMGVTMTLVFIGWCNWYVHPKFGLYRSVNVDVMLQEMAVSDGCDHWMKLLIHRWPL